MGSKGRSGSDGENRIQVQADGGTEARCGVMECADQWPAAAMFIAFILGFFGLFAFAYWINNR
jgi:hypothetical protein